MMQYFRKYKKNKVLKVKYYGKNWHFTNIYQMVEKFYSKEEIDFACEYYLEWHNTQ